MSKITHALLLAFAFALSACDATTPTNGEPAATESARGPNGGRLLTDGDFTLELAIFEAGVPPEFHAWATAGGAELPAGIRAVMKIGGETLRRIALIV